MKKGKITYGQECLCGTVRKDSRHFDDLLSTFKSIQDLASKKDHL